MNDFKQKSLEVDKALNRNSLLIDDLALMAEKKINKGRATTLSSDEFMDKYGRKI